MTIMSWTHTAGWTADVLRAQGGHAAAVEAARAASRERAVAVWRAHQAGATYRALAAVLAVSVPVAFEIAKAGQRMSEEAA